MTIERHQWERAGYTIAGHTNSSPMTKSGLTNITIHYPGGGTYPEDPSQSWAKSYVSRMQKDYVDNRGYSLGYNMVVLKNGLIVQSRDTDFQCAANGTRDANKQSFAIQIATEIGEAATPAAIAAVKSEVARIQNWCGRKLEIKGHRDWKPTGCPGDQMYYQLKHGVFDVPFGTVPDPVPVPDPDPVTSDVLWTRVEKDDGYWSIARRVYADGSVQDNARVLGDANDNKPLFTGQLIPVPGQATLS